MRFLTFFVFLSLIVFAGAAHAASSGTAADTGVADQAVRGFYLALQDYYRIPESEIVGLKEKGLSYDELAVVFFIAEQSQVTDQRVAELRLTGKTWTDVAYRLGLTPDVFYVPVTVPVTTPPYSHAYKGYSSKPRREWKTVSLTEKDVVNLVNLRFIVNSYGCPPEKVIAMRAAGKTFLQINEEMRKATREKAGDKTVNG